MISKEEAKKYPPMSIDYLISNRYDNRFLYQFTKPEIKDERLFLEYPKDNNKEHTLTIWRWVDALIHYYNCYGYDIFPVHESTSSCIIDIKDLLR
jgi:hypothetical protein